MTRNKKRNEKAKKMMDRNFMMAKIFLAITPIIAYLYVQLSAMSLSLSIQEILTQQTSITIVFMIAMINPYIAYLLHLTQKKLESNEPTFAYINMILLLASQALVMNYFYFAMLAYVFYKALKFYHIQPLQQLKSIRIKQAFYCGGGSMIVVFLSCICLFATLRLM